MIPKSEEWQKIKCFDFRSCDAEMTYNSNIVLVWRLHYRICRIESSYDDTKQKSAQVQHIRFFVILCSYSEMWSELKILTCYRAFIITPIDLKLRRMIQDGRLHDCKFFDFHSNNPENRFLPKSFCQKLSGHFVNQEVSVPIKKLIHSMQTCLRAFLTIPFNWSSVLFFRLLE